MKFYILEHKFLECLGEGDPLKALMASINLFFQNLRMDLLCRIVFVYVFIFLNADNAVRDCANGV